MIKRWFRRMREQAVKDYEQVICDAVGRGDERIRILDCGCNDGRWTRVMAAGHPNASLTGIEIVGEQAKKAEGRGIQVAAADLNKPLPFDDGSFDIIHANQVIEHLYDTDMFLRELHRLLRPGGKAVICTENLASWHNIAALVLGWQPFSLTNICTKTFQIGNPLAIHAGQAAENPASWTHLRVFAWRGLKEVFEEWGFEVVQYKGSGYYPFPGLMARLDPRHAAFLTIVARKPA